MSARIDLTSAEPVCCPRCRAAYRLTRQPLTLTETLALAGRPDAAERVLTAACDCPDSATFAQIRRDRAVLDTVVVFHRLEVDDDRIYAAVVVA